MLKEDIEVTRLQDIPDFEILVMNAITQGAAGAAQAGIGGIVSGIGGF